MKKYWRTIILLVVIILAISSISFLGYRYYKKYMTNKVNRQQTVLTDIYQPMDDNLVLVYQDQIMPTEQRAKHKEGTFYLPLTFVMEYLITDLYYDQAEKTLTYTTNQDVIRLKTNQLTYYVNNEPLTLRIGITEFEGQPYLPAELVAKFGHFKASYQEKYRVLIIDNPRLVKTMGTVELAEKEEAFIRTESNEQSEYIHRLQSGQQLYLVGEQGNYAKVRTEEGFFGYVLKDKIGLQKEVFEIGAAKVTDNPFPSKSFDGKISLVWHQVFQPAANNSIKEKMLKTRGVDVISPTWFDITSSEAEISSLADLSYVRWAHQAGYQVWPLFSNGFDKKLTHEVLKSTEKRDHLIRQILAFVKLYELDGINIDFENVAKEDGANYVQFVKELSLYLKQQGVVVSVDMYVPKPWTEHYGRSEIGKYIDYLIIMGYDEHWSTSPRSGSVASLGFVESGVVDTLKSLPKEKVMLGLPFYTRLWAERGAGDQLKVSSKAYGMNGGKKLLEDNEATVTWDEVTAQYYGEYKKKGVKYRMWLEDKRSLGAKLKVAEKYDLAGVAGWKLGLESEEAWQVISDYSK